MAKDRQNRVRREGEEHAERPRRASPGAIGWDAYRGWLGQMSRPPARRQGPESVYTWKGYQAWAAKVRAAWDSDT